MSKKQPILSARNIYRSFKSGDSMLDVLVGYVGRPGGFCLSTLRGWKNRYGQENLPILDQPDPKPANPLNQCCLPVRASRQ